jgi:hypothetical protein
VTRRWLIALSLYLVLAAPFVAAKDNPQIVDEGTFVIYLQGRQVGTEKFKIEKRPDMNVTVSEVKIEDGGTKAAIGSELQLYPNGDFKHYDWKETEPERGVTTVDVSEAFLVEHVVAGTGDKPHDLTFMLPPATNILDDYFFVHRELLVWKYLATVCANSTDKNNCPGTKQQFGTFNPRQQSPLMVTLEFKGKEKVTLKGVATELNRFDLTGEAGEWTLWTDPATHKLMRITVPDSSTEIVRQ